MDESLYLIFHKIFKDYYIIDYTDMILDNDIMCILLEELDLNSRYLYKISLLNKEHAQYMKKYYTNIFITDIQPTLNFQTYINQHYTCSKCFKINAYVNNIGDVPICNDCVNDIEYCDLCGVYRDKDDLIFNPYHETYKCKDNCIYVCVKCDKNFENRVEVEHINNFIFMCYPCYVQKNIYHMYKRRKLNNL